MTLNFWTLNLCSVILKVLPFLLIRYELREDRKRESARTTGHIDNLKKDIIRSIKSQSVGMSMNMLRTGQPNRGHSQGNAAGDNNHRPAAFSPSLPSHERSASGVPGSVCPSLLLDSVDMEDLKQDIIRSLKLELRDIARDLITVSEQARQAQSSGTLPISSELYQTHLYTQL